MEQIQPVIEKSALKMQQKDLAMTSPQKRVFSWPHPSGQPIYTLVSFPEYMNNFKIMEGLQNMSHITDNIN